MNSRAKGKRGELEASKEWASVMGGSARRGKQFSGSEDSPDIVTDYPGLHLEGKRVERGNIHEWVEQAVRDAGSKVPVVLHRRNHRPWLVTMRLTDVPRFLLEASAGPQVPAVGAAGVSNPIQGEDVCSQK